MHLRKQPTSTPLSLLLPLRSLPPAVSESICLTLLFLTLFVLVLEGRPDGKRHQGSGKEKKAQESSPEVSPRQKKRHNYGDSITVSTGFRCTFCRLFCLELPTDVIYLTDKRGNRKAEKRDCKAQKAKVADPGSTLFAQKALHTSPPQNRESGYCALHFAVLRTKARTTPLVTINKG